MILCKNYFYLYLYIYFYSSNNLLYSSAKSIIKYIQFKNKLSNKTLAKRDMTRHVTGDVTRYLF